MVRSGMSCLGKPQVLAGPEAGYRHTIYLHAILQAGGTPPQERRRGSLVKGATALYEKAALYWGFMLPPPVALCSQSWSI